MSKDFNISMIYLILNWWLVAIKIDYLSPFLYPLSFFVNIPFKFNYCFYKLIIHKSKRENLSRIKHWSSTLIKWSSINPKFKSVHIGYRDQAFKSSPLSSWTEFNELVPRRFKSWIMDLIPGIFNFESVI